MFNSFQLGSVTVELHNGWSVTRFADGLEVHAHHAEQPGQAATALSLGYSDPIAMNKEHDLAHSLLCYWLGLPCSPTLRDVATDNPASEIHFHEEQAVLALTRFANAVGVSLVEVARKISRGQ
jgi:hypothetical protein